MTLLRNPSFEDGWDDVFVYERDAQVPKGWVLRVATIGAPLLSAGAFINDDPPVIETATTIPEILHKPSDLLPPEQRLGGTDALILDGEHVYKLFSNYGSFSADLYQHVTGLTPGRRVALTSPIRVHYNPYPGGDGSPGACAFRAYCGPSEGQWLTYQLGLDDRTWASATLYADVPPDGELTVGAAFESRSEAGIDWFTDDWNLDYVDDPDPDPDECRGLPREDYVRVVNVVPGSATKARFLEIAGIAWDRGRQTVTGSYDDAGLGDLSDKTAVLWDIPQDQQEDYETFYSVYYPGTHVIFEGDDGGTEPPVEPPPEPPPSGEPDPYPLRSLNLIGLHSGFMRAQTIPYVTYSGTTVQKNFSAGDCYLIKQAAPDCITSWRKYVGNEEGRIEEKPTIRESAVWYLDQYTEEVNAASTNMGMSVDQLLTGIDAFESLNETIPTYVPDRLQRAVEFDVYFAEEVHKRYGDKVRTVLLNGAVGNPHESEVHYLLPAARASVQYEGFLGLHTYWSANADRTCINETWPFYGGRWMEWDTVFRANGVYPRYLSTESGICYAADCWCLNSGLGWKACGSFEKYLLDIAKYNLRALAWNAAHANRFAGMTIFGYGNWGWDDFELGDGEVILLNNWAQGPTIASVPEAMRAASLFLPDDKSAYLNDLEAYLERATYLAPDYREKLMRTLYEESE